jgi:hypothetical protein
LIVHRGRIREPIFPETQDEKTPSISRADVERNRLSAWPGIWDGAARSGTLMAAEGIVKT